MAPTPTPALPPRTRKPVTSPAVMPPALPGDVAEDVEIALAPAAHAPAGDAAIEVRARLRAHIAHLIDPAQTFADTLPEGRACDIAAATVRHVRAMSTSGGDQAACLTLLAKLTHHLARYAADPRAETAARAAA